MGETSLREEDVEALFKRVRISLHILDEPLALSKPAQEQKLSAKEVVGGKPPRRFLYHGEKARAFLVAAIPNFEQVRWSLATAMQRTRASQLANGELALAKEEAEQFFALLRFSVSAFQAKTVAASSRSSPLQQRTETHARDAPLDNVSRPKLSSVASLPAFSAAVPGKRLELAVDKLDTGSWCCVYPFDMDVPIAEGHLGQNADTALMLEIRTACSKPVASLPYDNLETVSDTIDDRAAQLEDLAAMLSTEILAHFSDKPQQSVSAGDSEQTHDCLRSDSALARRVVQILVATRPLVNISARVVGLPAAPGATAAIIEVSTVCDSAIETAEKLALQSVKLRSLGWQVQEIAAQSPLPFELAPGNCWISVFKITSFAGSAWKDTASQKVLNLLDPGGSLEFVGHYAALTADVQIGLLGSSWVLDIKHHISVFDAIQAPALSFSDGATYTQSDTEAETALDTPAVLPAGTGEGSNVSSGRSSGAFAPVSRLTMDMRRPGVRPASTNMGHAKTTSLDATLHSQLPQRKQSLISSFDKPLLPDILSQPGNRARRLSSKYAGDRNLASRARAVTINHASGHLNPPHSPVPTIQSVASSQASDARYSESSQRRSSVQTAIADQPNEPTLTSILVAFKAPSKARLGEMFVVEARLTNTTGVHFSRLSLIDNPPEPEEGLAAISRGLLPVDYQVAVPALPSGGSALVKLKYTAAAPQFHTIGPLRLVDLDAYANGKTLATIEAPFVIYVDEE
ncbi:hypothetical protein LPJ79_004919 [Coemansia sp. RSA 1821]|nr:hypothetical protein LPJ79_004919 [Coemansia sp. RSA 1821]